MQYISVIYISWIFSSVQSLSHVWLFATPWIAACQASLSITNSRSSPKLLSIESVMTSSHLILCRPLVLLPPIPPSIRVFFQWVKSSHEVAKVLEFQLVSFLPKKSQGWSPSEWTGWISLQSKGLSRVFTNTTLQKHQFFGTQPSSQSNSHIQQKFNLERRTRWWRSRWMWSASLSMDTSGIHLQTQKCMQNTSWEWTGVPEQWKII